MLDKSLVSDIAVFDEDGWVGESMERHDGAICSVEFMEDLLELEQ